MLKNLKVDIIYYNTPSDFEFEFNLGGYCRCRILNSKCATLKETIEKLALAVTRSTVVIIVGKLLGENGFVAPVAKSIGKELAPVDHRKFHISSPEPISLIEGSLPLVTNAGDFGGCIIESGPQSIVMLTDDKPLRDKISSELLSFYLTSLSRIPDDEIEIINKENTVEKEQHKEEIAEETENVIEPEAEETEEEQEEEENFIDISSNDDTLNIIPDELEVEEDIFLINNEAEDNNTYVDIDSGSDLILDDYTEENFEEDDFEEELIPTKKGSPLSTVLLILVVVLLLTVAALLYFVVYLPSLDGINTLDYLKEVFALNCVGIKL